jgi:hypothetical protein
MVTPTLFPEINLSVFLVSSFRSKEQSTFPSESEFHNIKVCCSVCNAVCVQWPGIELSSLFTEKTYIAHVSCGIRWRTREGETTGTEFLVFTNKEVSNFYTVDFFGKR